MDKIIKIILAVLFFVCLFDMPYGYFQIVRFAVLVGFAILAYNANEEGHKREVIIYVCLAILKLLWVDNYGTLLMSSLVLD